MFLSGGSIIEEGPAHEVLTNPRNPITARFLSVMEADNEAPAEHVHDRVADAVPSLQTSVASAEAIA